MEIVLRPDFHDEYEKVDPSVQYLGLDEKLPYVTKLNKHEEYNYWSMIIALNSLTNMIVHML